MDGIINLVKNMQTGEIKLLRHFHRLQNNNDKKKNLLFENALKWKNCKTLENIDEKAIFLIYGKKSKSDKTFEKLKCRLKTDILNILLLQESSVKFRSKYEMAIFDCRRLTLQGDILLGRGLYQEGTTLLKKASALAQKNELYAELVQIDNICNSNNILKEEENDFIEYHSKIKAATLLMEKLLFAKNCYNELIANNLFKTMKTISLEEWQKKLDLIKNDYSSSKSAKIGFYYYISCIYLYRSLNQYEKSLEFALELLKLQASADIFKTSYYSGNIHLEVAKSFLHTKRYDSAIIHSDLSFKNFGTDMMNAINASEIQFHCYINLSDHKKAKEILTTVLSNVYLLQDNFLKSKWSFFNACLEFKLQDYKKAVVALKNCNELFKDKTGWMLGCTFFEAQCRIEAGNFEWFEYRLDAMKKLMLRHNKGLLTNQNNRFALIFTILKTLNKNNYNFVKTIEDEKENIKLLSEEANGYRWNIAGSEPIRFDEWIKGKAEQMCKARNSKLKSVA